MKHPKEHKEDILSFYNKKTLLIMNLWYTYLILNLFINHSFHRVKIKLVKFNPLIKPPVNYITKQKILLATLIKRSATLFWKESRETINFTHILIIDLQYPKIAFIKKIIQKYARTFVQQYCQQTTPTTTHPHKPKSHLAVRFRIENKEQVNLNSTFTLWVFNLPWFPIPLLHLFKKKKSTQNLLSPFPT